MGHGIILGGNGLTDREFIDRPDGTWVELGPPDEMSVTLPSGEVTEVIFINTSNLGAHSLRLLAQKVRGLFGEANEA